MSLANLAKWSGVSSINKKTYTANSISSSSIHSFTTETTSPSETLPPNDFGTLIVIVMKAKNLHNRRAISKQNPYCSVRISRHSDRTKAILRGGQAPVWDHETRFRLSNDDDNSSLKLCVFDQNGSHTEIIGDAQIPLKPAFEASVSDGYDAWFPIHYNKKYVGEVYLEMTFYPKRQHRRDSRRSSTASSLISSRSRSSSPVKQSVSSYSLSSYQSPPAFKASYMPPMGLMESMSLSPSISPVQSPQHSPNLHSQLQNSLYMKHSESMPSLRPPSRTGRPLPQIPQDGVLYSSLPPELAPTKQEDISKLINDGYEDTLLRQLNPSYF